MQKLTQTLGQILAVDYTLTAEKINDFDVVTALLWHTSLVSSTQFLFLLILVLQLKFEKQLYSIFHTELGCICNRKWLVSDHERPLNICFRCGGRRKKYQVQVQEISTKTRVNQNDVCTEKQTAEIKRR